MDRESCTELHCPRCGRAVGWPKRFCGHCGRFVYRRQNPGLGRVAARSLLVLAWFAAWPLSELVGRPPEAEREMTWCDAAGLFAVAGLVVVVMALAVCG